MLSKLPFYAELNIIKIDHAFTGYTMSYKVEIIEKKIQLNSQKQVNRDLFIEDLFIDLLNETKGEIGC